MKITRSFSMLFALAMALPAAAAITVPLDLSSGRPVVEVTVAGGHTLHLVLDTGASGTVIDAGVAVDLGLETVGTARVGDPSGRNVHEVDRVLLPGVAIGGRAIGDLEASALDLPGALGHGPRSADGVLSVRSLAPGLVTLDLAGGQLRLADGRLDLADPHVTRYYTDGMEIPWIHARVGELTVQAFLDTGNPMELSLPRTLARHLDLAGPLEVIGKARTVSSTFEIAAAPLAGDVVIAGHHITDPTLHFDELHRGTQANIGSGLLRRFEVTLDQSNGLVRFAPRSAGQAPTAVAYRHAH